MIIEDKIKVRLTEFQKINDNIIYLADCEVEIKREKKLKKEIKRSIRIVKLTDIIFEKNQGKENEHYSKKVLENRCSIDEFETLVIKKIILKKELSCSLYKR